MVYTYIDIETTGFMRFDANNELIPDLLEFSFLMVDTSTWNIVNHGNLYFYQPHFDVDGTEAQKIHGLTSAFLRPYEGDFNRNLIALQAIMSSAIIVGKNSDAFDIPFIHYFIEKYRGKIYDINEIVRRADQKAYDQKTHIRVDVTPSTRDVQKFYAPIYRAKKIMKDMGQLDRFYAPDFTRAEYSKYAAQTHGIKKRGSLTEYAELIPNCYTMADAIYNQLSDKREARAHTGMYDCLLTLLVDIEYMKMRSIVE